jgi:radical SAM protein with 4Fe4S-binding SPASM domain
VRGFLSVKDYQIILKKIAPYATHIGLFNYGEPLLNKEIWEMVSLTANKGIYTCIHSNLTVNQFDETKANTIVECGLSELSASIDGATQETYEKYRRGGNFELAVSNLEQLQKAKVRLGSETPELVWSFLINRYNESEQEKAKEMASNIGVTIKFSLMNVWGNESWESSLHKETRESGLDHSENYRGHNRSLPILVNDVVLHPNLHSWCVQPLNLMIINWNGDVFPCCTVSDDRYSLGNLLSTDIDELWNNNRFRKCRQFLYNYGARQNTNSVCEILPCAVQQKHI